jgi:23S rRNA (cytidine1920-2'-O)/16S rRNA (cytidine1409-2'-O)-methyltransferase
LAGTDARHLAPGHFVPAPDLIACDASFISLTLVLPAVLALAAPRADLLALIKPQFEVGRGHTRKGIVRDDRLHRAACDRVAACIAACGWAVRGVRPSPVTGRDGNLEYLVAAVGP